MSAWTICLNMMGEPVSTQYSVDLRLHMLPKDLSVISQVDGPLYKPNERQAARMETQS